MPQVVLAVGAEYTRYCPVTEPPVGRVDAQDDDGGVLVLAEHVRGDEHAVA